MLTIFAVVLSAVAFAAGGVTDNKNQSHMEDLDRVEVTESMLEAAEFAADVKVTSQVQLTNCGMQYYSDYSAALLYYTLDGASSFAAEIMARDYAWTRYRDCMDW